MNKSKIILIAVAVIVACAGTANSEKVPQIENISEALASKKLEDKGFMPEFQSCFSNEVMKHVVIPGSQDPQEGIEWFKGGKVKAVVSEGSFPLFIGLSQEKAIEKIKDLNLSYEIVEGRNTSYIEQYVYNQYPLPEENLCLSHDSIVRLYVNSSSRVIIDSPDENSDVNATALVRGRLLDPLDEREHLWIAVNPIKNVADWWFQTTPSRSSIVPVNGEFVGNAFLGGNQGDPFKIAILIVDNETNKKIMEWDNLSRSRNIWPSITEGYPEKNLSLPKEVIDGQEEAEVIVILNE